DAPRRVATPGCARQLHQGQESFCQRYDHGHRKVEAALTPSLLGESWWAAPPPMFFVFTPVTFVGFLVPLASRVRLPAWRPVTTPVLPVRRAHRVIADGDLEQRLRNVLRLDERPRTVPGRSNVPSVGEDPVLVCVEKNVRWRVRGVVHRASLNNDEGRRTW